MSLRRFGFFSLRLSTRRPGLTILLSVLIFAVMGYWTSQITQAGAIEDQLDPDMQTTKDLMNLRKDFSSSNGLIAVITPKKLEAWNSRKLCVVQNWIHLLIDQTPEMNSIFTPFHLRRTQQEAHSLSYPSLLKDPCTSQDFIQNFDQNLSVILGTPWQKFSTDPEAHDFTIAMGIKSQDPPGRYGSFNPEVIQKIMTLSESLMKEFDISWVGVAAQQFYTIEGMAHSQFLNLIVIALFLSVLRILFGTWIAGIMFLITLFFTNSIVYGGMALAHHPMDALSVSLFLILSVASLEDFIFISYDRLGSPDGPYRKHFRRLLLPSFWTSLSTAVGFGSLMISNLVSIRHFGLWAAMGSLVEWFAVFVVWPAFLQKYPRLRNWVLPKKSSFFSTGQKLTMKSPSRWFTRLSLLVFPLGFIAIFHFQLAQTPTDTFPADHPMTTAIEHLKKTRGWIADASLIFSSGFDAHRKTEILNELKKDPLVQNIESRESVLEFLFQNGDSFRQELISREFSFSPMASRYENKYGETRAILSLSDSQTEKINTLRKKVDLLCPHRGCFLAGDFVAFADFSRSLIETLFESFFLSLGLVGLLLGYLVWQRRRRLHELPLLLISSFWGPAVMMCLIYLMGVSVNIITCIVASTLVGLTGDNAIQYLFAGKKDLAEGIKIRGIGSIQCALVMSLTSLVFLGSYFEPPRTLGILLALGFVTALLGDLWILKGLLKKDY